MKNEADNKLIAYAMHFASFLVERGVKAKKIVLFGSVASREFDKESDVDIFIDTEKSVSKSEILGLQSSFEKTFGEKWRLKGIANQLSTTVGDLNSKEWEDIRRTIQSYGVTLYGQYEELPKGIKPFVLFSLNFRGISRPHKVGLWRKLYGYAQKVGKKIYETEGLLVHLGGTKVDKGVVLVPAAGAAELKGFLGNNKVRFRLVEFWSDQLSSK
ncbi:MAG TPA: nucleotidyltransferase domain-containing protein [Candidatus Nanoarchaeia archaeon]|nr:nucleotidyltransferase domain-containing protein [Candidatus Nanoarchaeia archaeon]